MKTEIDAPEQRQLRLARTVQETGTLVTATVGLEC